MVLGVIGEYVARGYIETKRRPRFLISEMLSAPAALQADRSTSE
jgi:hypothetical protein